MLSRKKLWQKEINKNLAYKSSKKINLEGLDDNIPKYLKPVANNKKLK